MASFFGDPTQLAPPRTLCERRPDGSLLLRSPEPLGDHARCIGEWVEQWARDTPEALALAERDAGGDWRRVTYRELRAAIGRVGQEMEPLIRPVYQQRQCSVLLNRDAIVLGNPAMDITPAVVTALNAKITQFTFDRERLDQQQPAAAAPAQTTTPQRR